MKQKPPIKIIFGEIVLLSKNFKHFSLFAFGFSLLFLFALTVPVSAQEESFEDTAPPPLKIISKGERTSLEAETNVSERTKLALTLMENRLKRAEDFNARGLYGEMFDELGGFHALIDNTLFFLNKNDTNRGKVLNNFKRLELNLRRFIPRIELIRRELPARYELYVRSLIKNLRAARGKAVEPFFGDSVVPNDKIRKLK
jgi:hypothetical protein